jgi:hypothetical protein
MIFSKEKTSITLARPSLLAEPSSERTSGAGLVVGDRLEVRVHFAFGGFHLEAWLTRC